MISGSKGRKSEMVIGWRGKPREGTGGKARKSEMVIGDSWRGIKRGKPREGTRELSPRERRREGKRKKAEKGVIQEAAGGQE